MSKARKLTALILSVVMVLSCSVSVMAATADNVYQYGSEGGYLAIGDSISRGYGTDGYYLGQSDNFDYRTVDGSFPTAIAEAVGCNPSQYYTSQCNFLCECFPGQTLYSTLDLFGIEDGVTDTEFQFGLYSSMLNYYGYSGSTVGAGGETYQGSSKVGDINEFVKNADLITVEIGMCDVFYRAMCVAASEIGCDLSKLDVNDLDAETIARVVATALEEANWGYSYWLNNYTKLLDRIKELNPDATVVIVGAFNMVSDITLNDELVTPLGSAFSILTDSMNVKYKEWAAEYGYIYADISGTESLATERGWSLMSEDFFKNSDASTHPSQEGNDYIARQILSVLPEKVVTSTSPSTDIVVDLGAIKSVDNVIVNGKYVKDYSMNGSVITVKCDNKSAKSLIVSVKGTDNKITARTYTLSYADDKGYISKRVYGTSDAEGLVTKPIATAKKIVTKIKTTIKSLFKR